MSSITQLKCHKKESVWRNKLLNAVVLLLQNEIAGQSSFKDSIQKPGQAPDISDGDDNLIDTTQKGAKKHKN
jgi:hypothetical protein